jgi:predicted RNA-binding protein with PIN domain
MAIVLVDAENVRRSVWPNIAPAELERLSTVWARARGHDVRVVWEGDESADDRIARTAGELDGDVWVITSDRELRGRVKDATERIVGGGAFARELVRLA